MPGLAAQLGPRNTGASWMNNRGKCPVIPPSTTPWHVQLTQDLQDQIIFMINQYEWHQSIFNSEISKMSHSAL